MREMELEKILVRRVAEAGGKAFKWVSPGHVGVPDRICVLPEGKIVFVEMKNETGKLRAVQVVCIEKLRKLGCDVRVLHDKQEVEDFGKEIRASRVSEGS
jgi:hypothetical protein